MVDVAAEAETRRIKKEIKKEKKIKREEKTEREQVGFGDNAGVGWRREDRSQVLSVAVFGDEEVVGIALSPTFPREFRVVPVRK